MGGWIGTSDTMAALEAITDFAQLEAVGQRKPGRLTLQVLLSILFHKILS